MPDPLPPWNPLQPLAVVQPVVRVLPAPAAEAAPLAPPATPPDAAASATARFDGPPRSTVPTAAPPAAGTATGRGRRREDAQRCWALVPCAGVGSRATAGAADLPKQYRNVAGRPMVAHTLAAFAGVVRLAGTLVVVAPGDRFFDEHPLALSGARVLDCGGATRAASVAQGLAALARAGAAPQDWVLVHDAARCLVTAAQVDALIDACWGDPVGGLLAQPLGDTLKRAEAGRAVETLERADKWLAQTPQMFRLGTLAAALHHAGPQVTDEASAMEAMGHAPRLVHGGAHNFKVTWPEDFALAEAILLGRGGSATVDRYQGRRDDIPLVPSPRIYRPRPP